MNLDHLSNESREFLTVTCITTFVEAELLSSVTTGGVAELEGPEEGVDVLEVRTASNNLVNKIFHTDDAVLAENALNDGVVREGDTLTVDLSITTLVNKITDSLKVDSTPGDVGGSLDKHLGGSLVNTDEGSVLDLAEAEEL